jgi:hypothetical protein
MEGCHCILGFIVFLCWTVFVSFAQIFYLDNRRKNIFVVESIISVPVESFHLKPVNEVKRSKEHYQAGQEEKKICAMIYTQEE